jgi:hypothetical protein
MARRLGTSQTYIFNIIHQDLNQQKKVKPKVHHLTQRIIAQRKDRALPFYNLIKNEQYEYILTLDEAMSPLHHMNGKREFFYESEDTKKRRAKVPLASKSPSFPERMFAVGFCWRGQTKLYVVPAKAKVNAELFIKHILSPMMLVDVP